MLKLVTPSLRYKRSFLEATAERIELSRDPAPLRAIAADLPAALRRWQELARGINLRGAVPQTIYWLVESKEYIGEIHIRHQPHGRFPSIASHIYYDVRPSRRGCGYGTILLRLGLIHARKLGLKKLILTCREDHLASRKIIEANGGIL